MRVVHIRFAEYNDKVQTSNAISAPRLVSIIAWFCLYILARALEHQVGLSAHKNILES